MHFLEFVECTGVPTAGFAGMFCVRPPFLRDGPGHRADVITSNRACLDVLPYVVLLELREKLLCDIHHCLNLNRDP